MGTVPSDRCKTYSIFNVLRFNSIQFNSIYLHSIDPARITIVLTDVEIVIISINYLVKECTIIVTIQLITKACIVCRYM